MSYNIDDVKNTAISVKISILPNRLHKDVSENPICQYILEMS
jgi:hypothetical protein